MAADTAGVERALGAVGTTFRLTRLYPPTHPAVVEALRQIGEAIPPLAALGTVEWKVGVTGLHWHGQQLLPRNAQIAQLAGLLYARGVRGLTLNPGMTPEHLLALFQVATGAIAHDDVVLGRITVTLGRRTSARLERVRTPTPAQGTPALPDQPADVQARELVACRDRLSAVVERPVNALAYPYGAVDRHVARLARQHFHWGLSCDEGAVRESFDAGRVPRVEVTGWTVEALARRITPVR